MKGSGRTRPRLAPGSRSARADRFRRPMRSRTTNSLLLGIHAHEIQFDPGAAAHPFRIRWDARGCRFVPEMNGLSVEASVSPGNARASRGLRGLEWLEEVGENWLASSLLVRGFHDPELVVVDDELRRCLVGELCAHDESSVPRVELGCDPIPAWQRRSLW